MPRYFSRLKNWVEDEEAWDAPVCDNMVTVCDHEATDTGLVDKDGNSI